MTSLHARLAGMPPRQFRTVRLFENLHPAEGRRLSRERDTFEVVWYHCYLDNVLESMLRRAFIRDRAVAELFERGPLWNFTAKVGVAFAVGLITPEERRDLECVNKIRNTVAHNIRGATFRGRRIRNWLSELSLVREARRQLRAGEEDGRQFFAMNPRERFGFCVWVLGTRLEQHWRIRRLARANLCVPRMSKRPESRGSAGRRSRANESLSVPQR